MPSNLNPLLHCIIITHRHSNNIEYVDRVSINTMMTWTYGYTSVMIDVPL